MSDKKKPTASSLPCPVALPITKGTFDDVIALFRHEVVQQYTVQREKFMDDTLGSTAEERKKRSQADQDKDFAALKKANPVLASSDPFKAAWLPTKGDVPSIPPREVAMAAQGLHPVEPKEGLMLHTFMEENDRLLAMSPEEIQSIDYLEGWMLRFILTRYFDFESAATRFIKMRAMFHKHNLTYTYNDKFTAVYNGGFTMSPMYAQYCTDASFELPPMPEVGEPKDETEKKARTAHPYRTHRTPIIMARARFNDFSKFDMEVFKKAWFFFISAVAASSYYEQTHGHVMMMSGKDSGMSNMNREFGNFASEAIQTVTPVKVQRIFMCHQGWFFNNIVSPLFKLLLSEKLYGKMFVSSSSKCKELVAECGKERIGVEFGGQVELPDNGSLTRKWLFAMMGREYKDEESSATADSEKK